MCREIEAKSRKNLGTNKETIRDNYNKNRVRDSYFLLKRVLLYVLGLSQNPRTIQRKRSKDFYKSLLQGLRLRNREQMTRALLSEGFLRSR